MSASRTWRTSRSAAWRCCVLYLPAAAAAATGQSPTPHSQKMRTNETACFFPTPIGNRQSPYGPLARRDRGGLHHTLTPAGSPKADAPQQRARRVFGDAHVRPLPSNQAGRTEQEQREPERRGRIVLCVPAGWCPKGRAAVSLCDRKRRSDAGAVGLTVYEPGRIDLERTYPAAKTLPFYSTVLYYSMN